MNPASREATRGAERRNDVHLHVSGTITVQQHVHRMILVIVESPAKCSKIQEFLGPGYKVMASFGHVRGLLEDLKAVGIDRDFEPIYQIIDSKVKQVNSLIAAAKSSTKVILASDDDREGEAIAFHVCTLLKLPVATTTRIVFHEITREAVLHAIAHPRTIDIDRVMSQQARAMLDMLIGFTVSRLLFAFGRGLGAGRCQTPALRLLCDREDAIEAHRSSATFPFAATWSWGIGSKVGAKSVVFPSSLIPSSLAVPYKTATESYAGALELARKFGSKQPLNATIASVADSETSSEPSAPFITSTLQQHSARMGTSPAAIMMSAQKLYEAGHITYMRTDSTYLSDTARTEAKAQIVKRFGPEYSCPRAYEPKAGSTVSDDGKKKRKPAAPKPGAVSAKKGAAEGPAPQAAHECIRPTHMEVNAIATGTSQEQRLYVAIWKRTMQSQMAASRSTVRKAVVDTGGSTPGSVASKWSASWERLDFPGWRILEAAAHLLEVAGTLGAHAGEDAVSMVAGMAAGVAADDEDGDERAPGTYALGNAAFAEMKSLAIGQPVRCVTMTVTEKFTQPPARYSEASLVKELEARTIGRPSTYANIIESVKKYAEKKSIPGVPTPVRTVTLAFSPAAATTAVVPKEASTNKPMWAQRDKLFVSPHGRKIAAYLTERFDNVFDYGYTAELEKELDSIAKGDAEWKNLLRQTWGDLEPRITDAKVQQADEAKEKRKNPDADSDTQRTLAEGVRILITRYGPKFVVAGDSPLLLECGLGVNTPGLGVNTPIDDDENGEFEEDEPPIAKGKGKKAVKAKKIPDRFFNVQRGVSFEVATLNHAKASIRAVAAEIAAENATDGPLGSYGGHAIVFKTGRFGPYFKSGEVVAKRAADKLDVPPTKEEAVATITAKATAYIRQLSPQVSVRQGPKGGFYVMKAAVGKGRPLFRKLPVDKDPKTVTAAECEAILIAPVETRKKKATAPAVPVVAGVAKTKKVTRKKGGAADDEFIHGTAV